MFKAKLFNFRDSQAYFKRYGISPDKHFDKLRENYGTSVAVEMIDRNMMKVWEDSKKQDRFERCPDSECPFTHSPT